jgi:hypothetical protein
VCNPNVDADFDGSNQCNDCDETNGSIHLGATERCNGVDDDCDGDIDETFDADLDGYTTCGTVLPGGGIDLAYVDCDDTKSARHPFACELCANASGTVACGAPNDRGNGVDENCDGYTDETCAPCSNTDPDGDGVSQCQGDCAPSDRNVRPGVPDICDGKDTDCNRFTTENCDVGDPCNFTANTDECKDRLICVESLSAGGHPTGSFSCTSFCNFSYTGDGLGDGCTSTQTCGAFLTPTANLHGCAVTTGIGTKNTGATCGSDAECRTGVCIKDQRLTGPPPPVTQFCTDLCGSDAYCSGGTTCQVWGSMTGRCWTSRTVQTRATGAACDTLGADIKCDHGPSMCIDENGSKRCTEPCCSNSDCGSGNYCSLLGPSANGPNGGIDTVPVCFPQSTGNGGRLAGAACTSNGQCASEFCDKNIGVCIDVCCNDDTCPVGLRCESALANVKTGPQQAFIRACLGLTPAQPLEKR